MPLILLVNTSLDLLVVVSLSCNFHFMCTCAEMIPMYLPAGWSDKFSVTCKKTSYTLDDTADGKGYLASGGQPKIPLGPCSYNTTFAAEKSVPICGMDIGLF